MTELRFTQSTYLFRIHVHAVVRKQADGWGTADLRYTAKRTLGTEAIAAVTVTHRAG